MGQAIYINDVPVLGMVKSDIDWSLDETEETVRDLENKLFMMVGADVKNLLETDSEGNVIPFMDNAPLRLREMLDEYREAVIKEHLLSIAADNPGDVTEDY